MDLSHLWDDDEEGSRRADAPAEKHLRSPILASLLLRLQKLYTAVLEKSNSRLAEHLGHAYIPRNSEKIVRTVCKHNSIHSYSNLESLAVPWIKDLELSFRHPKLLTPDLYPIWFARTLDSKRSLNTSMQQASELYREELLAYKEWADLPELQDLLNQEIKRDISTSSDTYEHYERYRYWDYIVEVYRSRKKYKKFGGLPLILKDIHFFFYDGYIMEQHGPVQVIQEGDRITKRIAPIRYMYTFEQVQMLQDACLARFNVFLALDAQMHNGGKDTKILLQKILSWQEDVLTKYGNKGYELVKGPESVAKSYMTLLTNGDVFPLTSFVRTVAKLQQKEEKLNDEHLHPLTDILTDIISSTQDLSTVSELFGCTKLSGHPFVYAEISAQSVREEGCPVGNNDLLAIRDYHCHFKALVLERYLEKHRTWPPFKNKCEPRENTRLHHLWKTEILHLPKKAFPLLDLEGVEFGKFMEFDYSPDYLDMIDDKAINPGASQAHGFWFKNPSNSYRRLLESLIKKKDIDTYEIVERMRRGKFKSEERIIELTQKEREFKTSARCFCKLTFEVRLFFVLTETNLKRFMGGDSGDNGYLPQQTMTMSNSKLRKRLYDLTSNKMRDNTCLVEVDFSRWNLRWRACSVNPVSRTLESIFGLPGVFSQAHFFFNSSTVVLTDKHSLPEGVKPGTPAHLWPNSDLVWRGHRGGFEGIQQTLWTICTIGMMYYALAEEECSFQMAGQGDNQVFYISFNLKNKNLQTALQAFLTNMERRCERLNHEVKPEECVDSTTVLTYGKEIYVKGVHILYSLKFSSRAFSRMDTSIPSLTKEVAGIVANSITTSGTLNFTYRAIWWKFIQVILLLNRRRNSPIYSSEKNGIDSLLRSKNSRSILLIPGSLGGLPMMPWTRYFSKGETDDLSFDCAATYFISKNNRMVRNYMSLLLAGEFTSKEIDVTNLINDPNSIPIERPNDASHLVSDLIAKKLPGIVNNTDLKQLINPALRVNGEKYKQLLTQMTPLHPKILADLFDLTPAGLYNKTVKRFTMTRTIEKLVPGIDVADQISRAGALLLSTLIHRFVIAHSIDGSCHPLPYECAVRLRKMWNVGLKHSSVGVYTPFDFTLSRLSTRRSTISASTSPTADLLNTFGASPPNFGTSTRVKVSDHGYRIVNCNSTMRDLKSAVLIFSELQGDISVRPLVDSIITSRSPWKLDQLLPLFPTVYGGTGVHRHAATSHKFSVLGSASVPTHITFSSDNAGILSGGEADYPVVFQTLYLTLTNIYQNLSAMNIPHPPSIAYNIPEYLDPIDTNISKFEKPISMIEWPDLSKNHLAYVSDMFASEVPVIPNPLIIKHLSGRPSSYSLIYSYIESVISPNSDKKRKIWDGILSPVDVFDFKEISRVNPFDVEKAFAWVALTDAFFELISTDSDNPDIVKLNATLIKKTLIYAGMWIRIRLHPMFVETDYNALRNIALQPGQDGYKRPVEYMATMMRLFIRRTLELAGNNAIPTLYLFNNWKESTRLCAKRRLILAHTLAVYPHMNVLKIRESIEKITPPNELLKRDPATYIQVISQKLSRKISDMQYTLPDMPTEYINSSPQESLRSLRNLTRMDKSSKLPPLIPSYKHHGIIKYTFNALGGYLHPAENNRILTDETRLRILRRRKIGQFSPLFSDWNAVLHHLLRQNLDQEMNYHIFGVGRGAVARVLCTRNIKSIGYDLLSTFPSLAHRSASYIPPEIIITNSASSFTWSSHTFYKDGDVLTEELDISTDDNSVAIVDLDCSFEMLLTFLRRLPVNIPIVTRHRGSHEEILSLISIIRPEKSYALVVEDDLLCDVILYSPNLPPVTYGNSESVCIKSVKEIEYKYDVEELIGQLWNVFPTLAKIYQLSLADDVCEVSARFNRIKNTPRHRVKDSDMLLWNVTNRIESLSLSRGKQLRIQAVMDNILSH